MCKCVTVLAFSDMIAEAESVTCTVFLVSLEFFKCLEGYTLYLPAEGAHTYKLLSLPYDLLKILLNRMLLVFNMILVMFLLCNCSIALLPGLHGAGFVSGGEDGTLRVWEGPY